MKDHTVSVVNHNDDLKNNRLTSTDKPLTSGIFQLLFYDFLSVDIRPLFHAICYEITINHECFRCNFVIHELVHKRHYETCYTTQNWVDSYLV